MSETDVITATRRWIDTFVIGLNLCPFALRVYRGELIRYVVSSAQDAATLLEDLEHELQHLAATLRATIETTLLIHPNALGEFLDYNDFLDVADSLLQRLGLEGIVQIASFHPHYQFAGTQSEDVENYTNRSPFPMLHLLREESVALALLEIPDADDVPLRNIATLQKLGRKRIRELRGE